MMTSQDPFDLNHNLGAGVSRKMTNFIMKAFINGRKLFGTPFYPPPGSEVDYFFDSKVLTDGELAPNDRCCRICGKIGHYMKDCPKRRRVKKKDGESVEDRDEEQRRCFQCGDAGHVRRDCPDYRPTKTRAPGPQGGLPVQRSSQSISVNQDGRSRNNSECSDSRQTPPTLPQSSSPQAYKAPPLQQMALLGFPPPLGQWPQFKLNDPSIIFAQPAPRGAGPRAAAPRGPAPRGAGPQNAKPDSGQLHGPPPPAARLWEHHKPPQYAPSWRYPVPHPYIQNSPGFHQQGSMAPPPGSFPLLPHVRRPLNLSFLQQKK
ncbi:hypothetical protein NL108_001007 [Boleophthalmus pectinirostris]|nr:hypothetical protein NL108_001007 [Boleophthalmus pectinirostris]